MIKILLPHVLQSRLIKELKMAQVREIGGIIMGEHVEQDIFRIYDLTVQQHEGTWISFVRKIEDSLKLSLRRFYRNTGFNYEKFNYLGEWHSHPSFNLQPSSRDRDSMWEIVQDPYVGVNFAILMIVKLEQGRLAGNVFLFAPGYDMMPAELIMEDTYDR